MHAQTIEHVCDGCAVREPAEHRCHYDDGPRPCTCARCNTMSCAKCGFVFATNRGSLPFGWSFVNGEPYCNAHAGITEARFEVVEQSVDEFYRRSRWPLGTAVVDFEGPATRRRSRTARGTQLGRPGPQAADGPVARQDRRRRSPLAQAERPMSDLIAVADTAWRLRRFLHLNLLAISSSLDESARPEFVELINALNEHMPLSEDGKDWYDVA